jgi:hypothetical protein
MSLEESKEDGARIEDARKYKNIQGRREHEAKLKYGTAATIIQQFYPEVCDTYQSVKGKNVWCRDKDLTRDVVKLIKLKFKAGQYRIVGEGAVQAQAEVQCTKYRNRNQRIS